MRTRCGGIVIAFALLLLTPALASADVRYAEPGGNGPAPCDLADPCDIQVAVESAADLDVVMLAQGTYNLAGDPVQVTKDITVQGASGPSARPVLTATNLGLSVSNAGALVIDLEVQTSAPNAVSMNAGILDRIIAKTTGAGGWACNVTGGLTRNSVCASTGSSSGFGNSSGSSYSMTLRNVTAIAPSAGTAGGINISGPGAGSTQTIDAKGVIARGGTVDILASAAPGGTLTATFAHSNYGNAGSPFVTPAGSGTNQTEEPVFVNAATGNFHQASSSPTIDAGGADGSTGAQDFDGNDRLICSAVDIGADEFVVADGDSDGVCDADDNCPSLANGNQLDNDDDGLGDVCDANDDNDAVDDAGDACPFEAGNGANGCPAVAPNTSISKHPGKRTTNRRASFKFTASAAGAAFECKLDSRPWKPCTSPLSKRVKPGRHTFKVRATVNGVTDATPAKFRWRVLRH